MLARSRRRGSSRRAGGRRRRGREPRRTRRDADGDRHGPAAAPESPEQLARRRRALRQARSHLPRRKKPLLRARITARKGTALQAHARGRQRSVWSRRATPLRPRSRSARSGAAGGAGRGRDESRRRRAEPRRRRSRPHHRRDRRLSARAAHLRPARLPAGIRHPAEQPRHRLPVDAVHRRARARCARRWRCRRSRKA